MIVRVIQTNNSQTSTTTSTPRQYLCSLHSPTRYTLTHGMVWVHNIQTFRHPHKILKSFIVFLT